MNIEITDRIKKQPKPEAVKEYAEQAAAVRYEQPAPAPAAAPAQPPKAPEVVVTDARSRILLTFTANSWVQIFRNDEEHPFISRIFREGESYPVPLEPGVRLRLDTGNIGGMVFHLDGTALPRLGPDNALRRGIELSVENLQRYKTE